MSLFMKTFVLKILLNVSVGILFFMACFIVLSLFLL